MLPGVWRPGEMCFLSGLLPWVSALPVDRSAGSTLLTAGFAASLQQSYTQVAAQVPDSNAIAGIHIQRSPPSRDALFSRISAAVIA